MKKARVVQIGAAYVIVQLENGEEALLPGIELSTRYNPLKALYKQDLCSVGDELEVVEYGKEVGGDRKMVSNIRAHNDPWDKVKKWKDTYVKEMEIYSVTPKRAFGKIEPGIDGYIEIEELNNSVRFPTSWRHFKKIAVGDIIAGYVDTQKIDNEKRLVKIDFTTYIKNLRNIAEVLPVQKKNIPINPIKESKVENNTAWFLPALPEVRYMLVVDDSEKFLKEIGNYLNDSGIEVVTAKSKNESEKFLLSQGCPDMDVALLDVHLSGINDYSGLEIAEIIKRKQPRCRIIITTGEDFRLEKMLENSGELSISFFLYKPFGIEELSNAISATFREKPKKLKDFFVEKEKDDEFQYSIRTETPSIFSALSDLKEEIKAESAILFSIHPLSFEVKIVGRCGEVREGFYDYLPKLRYSPVKDVAIDREIIFENNAISTTKYPKHRWLHNAMLYESCIAFPVKVIHEWAFSIFTFHRSRHRFREKDVHRVKAAAKEVAHILEIQRLLDIWRSETPFILAGKTYGSMAHDLLNALSREFGIYSILKIIEDKSELNKSEIKEIKKHLESVQNELKRAKGIVETFRRMSASHHEVETEVDVLDVITDVSKNIKIEADALNTKINIAAVDKGIHRKIRMRRASFEQVIFKLILNAAQQIWRFHFAREKGHVKIELAEITIDDNQWLQILIHDTGPGIHFHSYEQVFYKGYTTKEDGCGMGLDICRNIIEQIGGEINVLKSILFVGTTFEVLLPLNIKEI